LLASSKKFDDLTTELENLFWQNFDAHNEAIGEINYGERNYSEGRKMPRNLMCYSRDVFSPNTEIASFQCTGSLIPFRLHTNADASVYVRRNIPVPRMDVSFDLHPNGKSIWGDFTRLTDGSANFYVFCDPTKLRENHSGTSAKRPTQTQFCQAFNAEFQGRTPVIIDLSSSGWDPAIWQNADDSVRAEKEYPSKGMVSNVEDVQSPGICPSQITVTMNGKLKTFNISLKSFSLANESGLNPIKVYHLRIKGWEDDFTSTAEQMHQLVLAIEKIATTYSINARCVNCTSGVGRAPSLVLYMSLHMAAEAAKRHNIARCYDHAKERVKFVDGKLNMAYVLHNLFANYLRRRSAFGWGDVQFASYPSYAQYLAILSDSSQAVSSSASQPP
jgi:hypothetical protein